MRDLCDTLMQNHAPTEAVIEEAIAQFRTSLQPDQRKNFNAILDSINYVDSEYAYKAFACGMKYYSELVK